MQALTAQNQIFHSCVENWEIINLFRNRVNVHRIRDNLFSITSSLDLGCLTRPGTIPTQVLHNAVTFSMYHRTIWFSAIHRNIAENVNLIFILYIIIYYNI